MLEAMPEDHPAMRWAEGVYQMYGRISRLVQASLMAGTWVPLIMMIVEEANISTTIKYTLTPDKWHILISTIMGAALLLLVYGVMFEIQRKPLKDKESQLMPPPMNNTSVIALKAALMSASFGVAEYVRRTNFPLGDNSFEEFRYMELSWFLGALGSFTTLMQYASGLFVTMTDFATYVQESRNQRPIAVEETSVRRVRARASETEVSEV